MFLRETRRTNADGSVVSYLQLAHNQRHPVSGNPVAKVIHNFGRADKVDRAALARLVSSISRFLTPEQAAAAAATAGGEVEVLDSRRLGGAWTDYAKGKAAPPDKALMTEVARLRRESNERLAALLDEFSLTGPGKGPKERPGG